MTGMELNHWLNTHSAHKRLSELRRLGCAREIGERECSVTKQNAILWEATDTLPVDQPSPSSERPERKDLFAARDEIRLLMFSANRMPSASLKKLLDWIDSFDEPSDQGSLFG
jgi:hypothetical protein